MADHAATSEIRAAGALLWRSAERGTQVALIHRPKYDDWSFAKGKLQPAEHVLLAAEREVHEETGLRITLGRRLPSVHYLVAGLPKTVDYWSAEVMWGSGDFAENSEVDELEWVASEQAGARLSYPHDVQLLADFLAGPQRTVPLILVRHASAGSKSEWRGDDQERGLDERGKGQAALLARLISCFGPARVLSSPAERCLATVRPFADSTGAKVEADPALSVPDAGAKKSLRKAAAEAAGHAAARAAAASEPVVICAHRENLALILEAACDRLRARVPAGPPLRKAGFWVLHRADGHLAAAEQHQVDDES